MRLSPILAVPALALSLAALPALAQSGSDAGSPAAEQVPLADIPADEMVDMPVHSSEGTEIGRVAGVIPAGEGIESVIVDVSVFTGVGESTLAFLPEDLAARREDGSLRLVTDIDTATIEALAATAN